ncbi:MAG: hypothetical protein H6822_11270 [Planctomycetaceae bacterium]|nr:hypothetical protein [Planctomycetales bacterium]MCB9922754.1 hypothetical protein [Planctomycetaceae bacterium]
MHRCRRWVTLACGLSPIAFVIVWTVGGYHSIYLSRGVATSHLPAQADCKSCHQTPWQPLVRLARVDNDIRSVHDVDCQRCHRQNKQDHNSFAPAKGVPDCAVCHQEHRGFERLTDHADDFCTKCHSPFEQHPEFAVHRGRPTDSLEPSEAMMYRELLAIAEYGPTPEKWMDKTALHFNHQDHLKPLHTVWEKQMDASDSPKTVQLQCADCHQQDDTGLYMRPIVFEQHCQQCHPLRFSGKLSEQPLPHETPDIVHGVLRDRLMAYADDHPEEVVGASPSTRSRLPNKSTPTAPKDRWNWVEEELRLIESSVFQAVPGVSASPKNNACQKCHFTTTDDSDIGFQIQSPSIPVRWFAHSRFDHSAHRDVSCIECHHVVPGATSLESTSVKDILMPELNVCQSCHGATRTVPTQRYGRQNCVECHQYHHVHESSATDVQSE